MTVQRLSGIRRVMNDLTQAGTAAPAIISPTPGGPFAIAWRDLVDGLKLAPVWLHSGWIDVVWRFRRTKLGPFWHTLGLAAFVIVMGVLWSTILRQNPFDYFRYVTASLIVWTLLALLVTDGTGIIIAGQATALSMRFPYIAFAFSHVWRCVLLFAHHFVLYLLVTLGTWHGPGWAVLLALPGLALVLANGLWMSLLVGMLALRRRDAMPAVAAAMQIMMFVTPVFWPKDLLGPNLAFAADFNPFYHLVRVMRDPLLGVVPPVESWAWVGGTLAVGTTLTLWVYGRWRDRMPFWY
jgi:ABC-2 type transport system permease protein